MVACYGLQIDILTTYRTGYIVVMLIWLWWFECKLLVVKRTKYDVSGRHREKKSMELPQIWQAVRILPTFKSD